MSKVNTTLSIDEDVKMSFKIETTRNRIEMSEAVERLMVDYIEISQKLHNERQLKNEQG